MSFNSVQSVSHVWLFVTPWTTSCQPPLSITKSCSLLKLILINQWCHTTVSSSVIPFSSWLQSFPASGPFLMSWFITSGGQSIEASASVLPMNIQDWFPLELTGLISLQSKGLPTRLPVPGILQARTLEWVPISFSNAWRWKVKVKSLSHIQLLATSWTAAHQASLSFIISWRLLKLLSIKSVMPSNHVIFCYPLLLLASIFPSIRVFSNEPALCIRWPKYWSFSFSISPSKEYSGLISFRIDWFDLLAVQGTLRSLLQHHSSEASILRCSAFFTVQLSHPYMTTGKTIALTRWTFVGKIMSLLLNMLSRLVIAYPHLGSINLFLWPPFLVFSFSFLPLFLVFAVESKIYVGRGAPSSSLLEDTLYRGLA